MANSTSELTSLDLIKGVTERENEAKKNDMKIYKSPTVKTSISALYARYLGNTVTVAFNGNFMKLPVDGSTFEVSRGHYNELMKYLRHIDRQIRISQQNAKFMGHNEQGDFKPL